MVAIDTWQERGFDELARAYLAHLPGETGVSRSIDETGALLVRRVGDRGIARHALADALARAAWLDPETGGPRR